MSNWDYVREERPAAAMGIQRCVIVSAEEAMTKGDPNANPPKLPTPMIVLKLKQSGTGAMCIKRIVQNDYFNSDMTKFYDAFPGIPEGDFTFPTWVGAEGAACYREDAKGFPEIWYFVNPKRAKDLPPFEGSKPERIVVTEIKHEEDDDDDDIPFLT